jgi:hypothetical protein
MTSFFMFLLMACPVAHAEEPVFTPVQEGDVVPFDGRLFNDAAVAKLLVDKQFEGKQCELRVDYEVGLMKVHEQFKYDILLARSEADDMRLNELISIKDDENKHLRQQIKPPNNGWWLAGGFIVGAATSIGIMFAVK